VFVSKLDGSGPTTATSLYTCTSATKQETNDDSNDIKSLPCYNVFICCVALVSDFREILFLGIMYTAALLDSSGRLMFCRRCLFSPRVLRGQSTNRRETLRHDRKLAEFYNASSKIRGAPPYKNWGQKHAKFRPILYHFRL